MTKQLQRRAFAFAIVCALTVGSLVTWAIMIASEGSAASSLLLSPTVLAELAILSIVASLPYSAMGAIAGGVVAARAIRASHAPQSRWVWIRRGCVWGIGLGAGSYASGVAVYSLFGASYTAAVAALAVFAPIGAITGALSGALVGAYCHCAIERHSWSCT